jgi:hypothetical protein
MWMRKRRLVNNGGRKGWVDNCSGKARIRNVRKRQNNEASIGREEGVQPKFTRAKHSEWGSSTEMQCYFLHLI